MSEGRPSYSSSAATLSDKASNRILTAPTTATNRQSKNKAATKTANHQEAKEHRLSPYTTPTPCSNCCFLGALVVLALPTGIPPLVGSRKKPHRKKMAHRRHLTCTLTRTSSGGGSASIARRGHAAAIESTTGDRVLASACRRAQRRCSICAAARATWSSVVRRIDAAVRFTTRPPADRVVVQFLLIPHTLTSKYQCKAYLFK